MAESLREFHIPIPENITKDQLREVCARYEMLYNISLKTEAEIKQKMLARADKALLKENQIEEVTKEFMDGTLPQKLNYAVKLKNLYGFSVAIAQLKAIKDILEGK